MTIITPLLQRLHFPTAAGSSKSREDDRYQGLARRLVAKSKATPVIGLTSSSRGEGVSTITVNLAIGAAEALRRPVLVVDANFDHHTIEQRLGLQSQVGVRDVLAGQAATLDCLRTTQIENLVVLGPGRMVHDSTGVHDQNAWRDLLSVLKKNLALVLVDMPPVEQLVAQYSLTEACDGVLLVVEAEKARKKAVTRAKNQLQLVGGELVGVALNKRRIHLPTWLYQRI